MQAIRLRKPSSDLVTTAVGKVIDTSYLVTTKDTVLEEEIAIKGAVIPLPVEVNSLDKKKTLTSIYLPKFKSEQIGRMIILNDMVSAANLVVRILEDWDKGLIEPDTIQRIVDTYHMTAVKLLSGKGGVVGNNILSTRVAESGRAVLLVNGDRHPKYAGIPNKIMHKLGIKNNDPVLIGRDPSIWHGSVEILIANHSDTNCIELHPVTFKQLGADCDGDCVYVYKLPHHLEECSDEIKSQILGFTGENDKYAEWPAYLKKKPGSEPVEWGTVEEDTRGRSLITGFSISPKDIVSKSDRIRHLCSLTGKDVVEECVTIANGLKHEEVVNYVKEQNATQLTMKLLLGPIGTASNRLKIIAGMDQHLLKSACVVSEWLQQRLLSSKHIVGGAKKEPYSIWDILDLVNRRGKYQNATLFEVLEEIEKMGMPLMDVRPIITHLWITHPLIKSFRTVLEGCSEGSIRLLVSKTRRMNFEDISVDDLVNHAIRIAKAGGKVLSREMITDKYWEFANGLTKICESEFPIFEITSGSPSIEKRISLAHRIAVYNDVDQHGLGRECLELALANKDK